MEATMRSKVRTQITKLCRAATEFLAVTRWNDTELDEEAFKSECECLIKKINNFNDQLRKCNEFVRPTITPQDIDKECEAVIEYEDKAVHAISQLESAVDRVVRVAGRRSMAESQASGQRSVAPTPSNQSNSSEIKLKPMELRKFKGHFEEWLPFWEQFRAAVHENDSLSVAVKFNFLSNCLEGKAAATIAGLLPTAECYKEAIKILQEEYGNNDKLIEKYIQKLVALRAVQSSSDVKGLRFLYNEVSAAMRTLAALNVPSSKYELMVKSILLKSIPSAIRVSYHRIAEKDNGEIKSLLEFLKKEIEAVEKSRLSESENKIYENKKEHQYKGTASALLLGSGSSSSSAFCVFCKGNTHHTRNCKSKMSLSDRKELLKREGRCFRCANKSHTSKFCKAQYIKCDNCSGRHMTTLCERKNDQNAEALKGTTTSNSATVLKVNSNNNNGSNKTYLQTAKAVFMSADNKKSVLARLVMDNGSQRTFVTAALKEKLNLKKCGEQLMRILPFGENVKKSNLYETVLLKLKSQYNNKIVNIAAVVVPTICDVTLPVAVAACEELSAKKLHCADLKNVKQEYLHGVNLLIGQDYYWTFNTDSCMTLSNDLVAVDTFFGWTVHGRENIDVQENLILNIIEETEEADDVSKFWSLESIGIHNLEEKENKAIEQIDIELINDRYQVNLPWKINGNSLHNNKAVALKRLRALTVKLMHSGKIIEYDAQIKQLLADNIAERIPPTMKDIKHPVYYMPHKAVYRDDKATTKIRIVFDASSSEQGMLSLNYHLSPGENMVSNLLSLLLKFRCNIYALVADIEKAFLQISIAPDHRDAHRFWWYGAVPKLNEPIPEPVEYRMKRVTFGVTSSPFLLAATIKKHLDINKQKYGDICELLKNSFYVDDFVASVQTKEEAQLVVQQANDIMKAGKFILKKWNSNHVSVLKGLPIDYIANVCVQKVLGLKWCTTSDELSIDIDGNVDYLLSLRGTKRNVLKAMAKLYDPLGILGPFTVRIKILLQKIWKKGCGWDELLPKELLDEFVAWQIDVKNLKEYAIQRCLIKAPECKKELHIFSDASNHAYGAVAYMRQILEGETASIEFICAKNRVRPLKNGTAEGDLTMPKLELTAALIAARLGKFIVDALQVAFDSITFWVDSTIALDWIRGRGKHLTQYVKSRVSEINNLTNVYAWKYCQGKLNPADMLTRGVKAKSLVESNLWRYGPSWLSDVKIDESPTFNSTIALLSGVHADQMPESKENIKPIFDITKCSTITKLLRVFRFIRKLKKQRTKQRELTYFELQEAENYWLKYEQGAAFGEDLTLLLKKGYVPRQSALSMLNPMIENGLAKMQSRLPEISSEMPRNPVIIPKNSYLSNLLIHEAHRATLHGGINTVLAHMRKKYWLIQGRQAIKKIIDRCVTCKRLRGKPGSEPWTTIPVNRIETTRPFETTGIDFAGPLYTAEQSDGCQNKAYVLLFTCAAVRAVHLELLRDMTTKSCIEALRRFIARYGAPKTIISDNARTFKRADLEFRKLESLMKKQEIQQLAVQKGIHWQYIPERAAWWGGFWERLVRTIKTALKSSIGKACLNFDELYTIIKEIEGVTNSRPLTFVSSDPNDLSPLTPGHFLSTATIMFPADFKSDGSQIAQAWEKRQLYTKKFVQQWKTEYLGQLRNLHIMKNKPARSIQIDDVVLIHDDCKPTLAWKLGLVKATYPGRDGRTRVCDVRLSSGSILKRPVQLLYPLEVENALPGGRM